MLVLILLLLVLVEFKREFKFSFPSGILLSDCRTDGERFDCINCANWAVNICCLLVVVFGAIGDKDDPEGC